MSNYPAMYCQWLRVKATKSVDIFFELSTDLQQKRINSSFGTGIVTWTYRSSFSRMRILCRNL